MKNWISKKYQNFSVEKYNELLNKQNGVCAICKKPELKTRRNKTIAMSIDHCHITGTVRGLLCSECNTGLGKFKDNPFLLVAALKYLGIEDAYR